MVIFDFDIIGGGGQIGSLDSKKKKLSTNYLEALAIMEVPEFFFFYKLRVVLPFDLCSLSRPL